MTTYYVQSINSKDIVIDKKNIREGLEKNILLKSTKKYVSFTERGKMPESRKEGRSV